MQPSTIRPESTAELLSLESRGGELLLGDWLEAGMPILVAGAPGCGKSWFVYWLGYSISTGQGCFDWAGRTARKVALLDGEMRLQTIQKRIGEIQRALGDSGSNFGVLARHTFRREKRKFLDLRTREDRSELLGSIKGFDVLIVDNVNSTFLGGNENDPSFWKEIEEFLFGCQDRGITPILVHHTTKSNPNRAAGSSKNERVVEAVITLSKISDQANDGASFNIQFGKFRELSPDATPRSARLMRSENGLLEWKLGPPVLDEVQDGYVAKVLELRSQGNSLGQIATIMNKPKSTIQDIVNRNGTSR